MALVIALDGVSCNLVVVLASLWELGFHHALADVAVDKGTLEVELVVKAVVSASMVTAHWTLADGTTVDEPVSTEILRDV